MERPIEKDDDTKGDSAAEETECVVVEYRPMACRFRRIGTKKPGKSRGIIVDLSARFG